MICKYVLEHRDYDVLALRGVKTIEALFHALLSFEPDVIFTDQDMPDVSGQEIVQTLKSIPYYAQIPVVMFSGSKGLEKLSNEAGADDYLHKPLKVGSFLDMLTKYAKGEK